MSKRYIEIKEEKICGGVVVSRLFIRYPVSLGNNFLDAYYKAKAERFYEFMTQKVFIERERDFLSHIENGGRRCHFQTVEYKLDITVTGSCKNKVSVKTEALGAENGTVCAYKIFSEIFDTETGTLCRVRDILKRRPREKYDGFYIKDGCLFLYASPSLQAKNLKISELSGLLSPIASFDIVNE